MLPEPVSETLSKEEIDEIEVPPSDLPSDEPPLESSLHLQQILLLISCLNWLWKDRQDYFCAGNLTIYYSPRQLKSELFRGPDFFVVRGTTNQPRKSWVVWHEEGKYPDIIIELLSDSTAKTDRELKKGIYQDTFRTPDYFWFDPHSLEFQGFHIIDGRYHPLEANAQGWLWSEQLELYLGIHQDRLRFFTPEGTLVPTPEEAAEAEFQRAETERQRAEVEFQRAETERQRAEVEFQRAETERQRAEVEFQRAETERQANAKLIAKLRELGVDPDSL
ncbi:Uma2 family endonuclease [Phormidium yuhuli AB48]|uniref:Uma2 family endonuclease n=1 Tax=Phormidium yuhuli AB48 TaxID=2940671 RepID=A0ABY5AWC4_9CYAN|nr:Uma2 family endonuclease [Phormidium yuhuli]USR93066.1 Uma2 family endonuclease [Phormidium yuhuli AB48]